MSNMLATLPDTAYCRGVCGDSRDMPTMHSDRKDILTICSDNKDMPTMNVECKDMATSCGDNKDMPTICGDRKDRPTICGDSKDMPSHCGDSKGMPNMVGDSKDEPTSLLPQQVLTNWLRSHSDPGKDPWVEERWEDTTLVSKVRECIDPTHGREGEERCQVQGGRDAEGRLEGAASLRWENGDTFQGSFVRGLRSGWGIVSCPEKGILAITGNWKNGELEGKGRLVSHELCNQLT